MRALTLFMSVWLMAIAGGIATASAGDYSFANTPEVVFPGPKGGRAHISPYPASRRATAVWLSDACWRECKSSCAWKMDACVRASDADACRPHLNACDRSCQRSCRTSGGPLLGFVDW